MFGIRESGRRWMRPAGVAAVVIGVVSAVGALMLAPASMAAGPRSATAALTELTVTDAAAAGVAGFSGRYGTADTPDLTLPSDADNGDFSDPDGVLDYITVNGTQVADTSWDSGSTQLTARANATGFELNYNGVDDFATAGSIDSYARCLDRGSALAYARGDANAAYVLGQQVPEGVPTTITATGAQLNMPDVDSGTLTVTVTRVENTVNSPTEVSAEAYLDVQIEGDLRDDSGATVYQGKLVDMKVGHVKVTCTPEIAPQTTSASASSSSGTPSSESPSSESPSSETPTSETPTSETPTSESPSETPNSESPSETPTSASGSSTASASDSPSTDGPPASNGGTGDGDFGPFLPTTGGSGGTILGGLVLGLTVALAGVVLLNLAARRSRG